jgi:hypothetical protein
MMHPTCWLCPHFAVGAVPPVGQLNEVVGLEAILVCQHVVVGGAAGALKAGVRVEVEGVLKGVLQVDQTTSLGGTNT